MDDEAVRIHVVAVFVRPPDQPLPDVLREVRGLAVANRLNGEVHLEGRIPKLLDVAGRQRAIFRYLFQDQIAPLFGTVRIANRIVVKRAFEHSDEGGALEHGKLTGSLAEIRARRRLDADGVVQERHGVHVGLEDLLLRVHGLDLPRRDDLLQLAIDRNATPDFVREEVSGQLLRDGRSALQVSLQGAHGRAKDSAEIDAAVVEKSTILDDEEGVQEMRRHLVKLDPLSIDPAKARDDFAARIDDYRRMLRAHLTDRVQARGQRN